MLWILLRDVSSEIGQGSDPCLYTLVCEVVLGVDSASSGIFPEQPPDEQPASMSEYSLWNNDTVSVVTSAEVIVPVCPPVVEVSCPCQGVEHAAASAGADSSAPGCTVGRALLHGRFVIFFFRLVDD